MDENEQNAQISLTQPGLSSTHRSSVRRLGCAILVFVWFALILSPCFLIALATQGEIVLQIGDLPGQVIRIWLVDGVKERGIGFSRPGIVSDAVTQTVCVQTDTSFFLWMGHGEGSHSCDCYSYENDAWVLSGSRSTIC